MARNKVSLIGAGNIGGTLGLLFALDESADVVILDVMEGLPQGKALDILHAAAVFNKDVSVVGTSDFSATRNSDLYIVTAGSPRKPGMSRDDLLRINSAVIKDVAVKIKQYSPLAKVIVITNPLDAMTQLMLEVTGFEKNRVMGMAGVLDSGRFKAFLSLALKVSVKDIDAQVLGGHGDTMVPLTTLSKVKGRSLISLIGPTELDLIVNRVSKAGGEIVNLLKTGSAYMSPAAAAYTMAKAIFEDKKEVFALSAYLEGEYGIKGYCMGVPAVLGRNGIESVIELVLNPTEKKALNMSFQACKDNVEAIKNL